MSGIVQADLRVPPPPESFQNFFSDPLSGSLLRLIPPSVLLKIKWSPQKSSDPSQVINNDRSLASPRSMCPIQRHPLFVNISKDWLFIMISQTILLRMDKRVIPRQWLQSCYVPFSWELILWHNWVSHLHCYPISFPQFYFNSLELS